MPTMYEIYDQFSVQYDELIQYEDYHHNLNIFLKSIVQGNTVLELGAGTGRVTKLYIDQVKHATCCDRASHMLDKAKTNLIDYLGKISFECMDTRLVAQLKMKADCIIEGWALGHTAIDEYHRINEFVSELFQDLIPILNENGKLIFIETLGTNTEHPKAPDERLNTFYHILENTYHMKRYVIRTDYKFDSIEDAKRILSFFFGEQMTNTINDKLVKEYTGVWVWEKK